MSARAWIGVVAVAVGLAACGSDERGEGDKRTRTPDVGPDRSDPDPDPDPLRPRLPTIPRDSQVIEVGVTSVRLNGRVISDVGDDLAERVAAALAAARLDPASPATRVTIVADKDTPYQVIVLVMGGAKTAGYTDIAFSIPP